MYKAYGSLSCLLVGKLLTFTNMAVTANCKLKLQLVIQMTQSAPSLRNLHNVFSGGVWAQTILLDIPIFTSWMFSTCVMKLKAIVRFSSFWMWPTGFGWYLHQMHEGEIYSNSGTKWELNKSLQHKITIYVHSRDELLWHMHTHMCYFMQDVAYKGGGTRGVIWPLKC